MVNLLAIYVCMFSIRLVSTTALLLNSLLDRRWFDAFICFIFLLLDTALITLANLLPHATFAATALDISGKPDNQNFMAAFAVLYSISMTMAPMCEVRGSMWQLTFRVY